LDEIQALITEKEEGEEKRKQTEKEKGEREEKTTRTKKINL
jgi:hypothetical protein